MRNPCFGYLCSESTLPTPPDPFDQLPCTKIYLLGVNRVCLWRDVGLVQVRYTRAFKGLISPPSEPPGEIMSFGVSPVNYSDSDSDLGAPLSGQLYSISLDTSVRQIRSYPTRKKRNTCRIPDGTG